MDYEVDLLHDIHDYMVIVVNMLMSFNSATNFLIYVICGRVSENTTGTDVVWQRIYDGVLHACW